MRGAHRAGSDSAENRTRVGAPAKAARSVGPVSLPTRTLVLFSAESDPALCAPRLPGVQVLQKDDLNALSVDEVTKATRLLLGDA